MASKGIIYHPETKYYTYDLMNSNMVWDTRVNGILAGPGFTEACQNASLGWLRRPWGGRRGRLSAQQGDLISGLK